MVKKRPIPRLEDCIDTKGMFDSKESDTYLKELRDTIQLTDTVYTTLSTRIDKFSEDMLSLQSLASAISKRYEEKASTVTAGSSNRKQLLQSILHHKLSTEDIKTLCQYIDYAFEYILWRINEERIIPYRINTITQLHKEKSGNRVLSHLYDNIACELKFTNSGKPNSDIYQLWTFRSDFNYTLNNKSWMEDTLSAIDRASKSNDTSAAGTKRKLSKNIEQAKEMIRDNIQDEKLAQALLSCINVVSQIS